MQFELDLQIFSCLYTRSLVNLTFFEHFYKTRNDKTLFDIFIPALNQDAANVLFLFPYTFFLLSYNKNRISFIEASSAKALSL